MQAALSLIRRCEEPRFEGRGWRGDEAIHFDAPCFERMDGGRCIGDAASAMTMLAELER